MNTPQAQPIQYSQQNSVQEQPVSVGDWILTFILLAIPLVNLILVIYWAVSDSTPASKRNFFRAYILLTVIIAVLVAAFLFMFGGLAMLASKH